MVSLFFWVRSITIELSGYVTSQFKLPEKQEVAKCDT
jgi:hypothetical protein